MLKDDFQRDGDESTLRRLPTRDVMIERFLPRPRTTEFIEIVTVGLPFCAFKLISGAYLVTRTSYAVMGWALIALGLADAAFNVLNAATVAFTSRRRLPVCSVQAATLLLTESPRAADIGTALDTLLSFSLVASMIAGSALPALTPSFATAWNVAVILNVLGAGALRVFSALGPPKTAD